MIRINLVCSPIFIDVTFRFSDRRANSVVREERKGRGRLGEVRSYLTYGVTCSGFFQCHLPSLKTFSCLYWVVETMVSEKISHTSFRKLIVRQMCSFRKEDTVPSRVYIHVSQDNIVVVLYLDHGVWQTVLWLRVLWKNFCAMVF